MGKVQRIGIICLTLALLALSFVSIQAQNEPNTTADEFVGSGLVLPVIDDFITAGGIETALTTNITGTTSGIRAFCNGDVAGVVIPRALLADEEATCNNNGISFYELVLAYNIVAFVRNPVDSFAACLTLDDINTIFAPSSSFRIVNWQNVSDVFSDQPLTIALAQDTDPATLVLDAIVDGDGFRSDIFRATPEEVLNLVATTPGMIGAVTLSTVENVEAEVTVIDLASENAGCVAPSAINVESDFYPAVVTYYLYVEEAAAQVNRALLNFIFDESNNNIVRERGLTPVPAEAYLLNQTVLSEGLTGRQFTAEEVVFEISPDVTGQVTVGGSAALTQFVQSIVGNLGNIAPNLAVTTRFDGEAAGVRRFCSGLDNAIFLTSPLEGEQLALCEANEITPISFELGIQAIVVVTNAGDEFNVCLSTEQLITLWGASGEEATTNWNQINPTYPDLPFTLFAPSAGNAATDLLLRQPGSPTIPVRSDTEVSADPLYRAAATANVSGALTYMTWDEYQRVLANNQANVRLADIATDDGCITPSVNSIRSGDYPLARTIYLVANQASLADLPVQSYLWSLFIDESAVFYSQNSFVGFSGEGLIAQRQTLQDAFNNASAAFLTNLPSSETTDSPSPDNTPPPPYPGEEDFEDPPVFDDETGDSD